MTDLLFGDKAYLIARDLPVVVSILANKCSALGESSTWADGDSDRLGLGWSRVAVRTDEAHLVGSDHAIPVEILADKGAALDKCAARSYHNSALAATGIGILAGAAAGIGIS